MLVQLNRYINDGNANYCEVRVTRSLVLCECFVDLCLSVCAFSFGHSVVCSSSIYGFRLPLWYLQTSLVCILGQVELCTCWSIDNDER